MSLYSQARKADIYSIVKDFPGVCIMGGSWSGLAEPAALHFWLDNHCVPAKNTANSGRIAWNYWWRQIGIYDRIQSR